MATFPEKFWKYKLDHIIVWFGLVIYFLINNKHLIDIGGWNYYLKEVGIKTALLVFLTYTNFYLLIPYLLNKKKYLFYFVSTALVIAIYVYISNGEDLYYYGTLLKVPGYTFNSSTFPNITGAILFGCFGVALKLSKQFYLQQQKIHEVQVEKLDTELKYLKAQINPHTLFNSINSVFSLIDRRNDTARIALAKFSEILRYQLYECTMDKIEIARELTYLNNYIELQKLRKESNIKIHFNVTERVKNFAVAPLIIAPFIENAFKYVSAFEEKENKIDISLDYIENIFLLQLSNTYEDSPEQSDILKGGIGLSNVKRRLELLYPGKFQLTISGSGSLYIVSLKLDTI